MDKIIHFDEELDSQVEENQDTNIEESVTESSEHSYLENNEVDQTMIDRKRQKIMILIIFIIHSHFELLVIHYGLFASDYGDF